MNWRSIDLNLLVVFDAVARERNITRASARLNMSQSAVSHALTRLRRALDDELFLRSPEGVEPTPYADQLVEPIRAALDVVAAALAPVRFDPASSRRAFTIAMDNRSALVLAAPLATLVAEQAPSVTLDVRPTGLLDLVDRLDRGGLDIAISCMATNRDRLSGAALFEDGFSVVVRQGHPAAGADAIDMRALASFPHLSLSSTGEEDAFVDEELAARGLARHVALRAPLHSASAILAGSDMVMVIGSRTARAFVRTAALCVLQLPFTPPRTTTSMLWHRRWDGAPAHRWLREAIRTIAAGLA